MIVLYILQIMLMFTVLVAAHELGHYLVARYFKMEVEEFSIGLGLPKWIYAVRNGTEYTLRALPLGGFVRVKGMEPEDDGSEVNIPDGFYSKGPGPRIWMLLAGPVFSMLAGVILLTGVWGMAGKPMPDNRPILADATKTGPGFLAGLRGGDRVLAIDGQPISTFFGMVERVRDNQGTPMSFTVDRSGTELTFKVTPIQDEKPTPVVGPNLEPTGEERMQRKLQVAFGITRQKVPFGRAFGDAFVAPFLMVGELAKRVTNFEKLKEAVGGPESMARVSYSAAKEGPVDLIELAGLLSMSLGIFNLLPIFPLDGGQITVAFAELLRRGRRLSINAQGRIQTIGLCAVLFMVLSVVVIDRQRDWGGSGPKAESTPKQPEQKR